MVKRLVQALFAALLLALIPAASAAAQQPRIYTSGDIGMSTLVTGHSLGADGSIGAALPGSPTAAGTDGIEGITFSPDGASLYISGYNTGILGWSVAANGSLTPTDALPQAIGTGDVVTTPDGRFLYTGSYNHAGQVFAFSRGADGKLTALPTAGTGILDYPAILAMAPDGHHIFVGQYSGGDISTYSIGVDGSLTFVSKATTAPTSALTVSPNGRNLYELTAGGTRTFAIAADGSLTSVGAAVSGGTGDATDALVSPDGSHLYAAYYGSQQIAVYRLGADGAPTQIAGSPISAAAGIFPGGLAMNAAGTRLYLSDENASQAGVYSVEADGLPIPIAGSPFPTGVAGDHNSIALPPDQPPVAAFTTVVNNRRATFDGNSSTDPDGFVARWDWDFGDGDATANGGPTVTHRYGKNRPPATLTVTDDSGCSTAYIAAGHSPYCNGGPSATVTMEPFQPKFIGKQEQKASRNVKLKLSCPVACKVKVVGRLKLSGKGVRAKKTKLEGVTKNLKAGKAKTLKLAIPARAVRLASESTNAIARLKVAVTDDAGDLFKERHGIRLK